MCRETFTISLSIAKMNVKEVMSLQETVRILGSHKMAGGLATTLAIVALQHFGAKIRYIQAKNRYNLDSQNTTGHLFDV